MAEYWDKDYYSIEYYGGEKYIVFHGFYYDTGEDCGNGTSRLVEYSGFDCPLIKFLEWDDDQYSFEAEGCKQYITDMTSTEAIKDMNTYYDGKPPIEMNWSEINMETPCGNYVNA